VTAEPEAVEAPPVQRGPAPPAPTVRAVARTVLPPAPTVRASAHVDGPVVRSSAPPTGSARGSAAVPVAPMPPPRESEPDIVEGPEIGTPEIGLRNVAAVRPESPVAAGSIPHSRVPEFAPRNAIGKATVMVHAPESGTSVTAPENAVDRPRAKDAVASVGAPERVPEKGSKIRRAILPVAVAAAAAFVAITAYLIVTEPAPQSDVGRWSTAAAVDSAAAGGASWNPPATGSVSPFGTAGQVLAGAPTRLKIKAIGVDSALESLHLGNGGVLDPPKAFAKAGWYADGTAPGDDGPAVIAGHVDSKKGPAIFYKLRELQAGDQIQVVRGGKTVKFTVTSTAWYPKTKFPTAKVYGPTPDRQLRLITCGGVFDHTLRSYKDNLVVYAVAG
jgi:LPXTG-site transpeptidase (sortase) family protein